MLSNLVFLLQEGKFCVSYQQMGELARHVYLVQKTRSGEGEQVLKVLSSNEARMFRIVQGTPGVVAGRLVTFRNRSALLMPFGQSLVNFVGKLSHNERLRMGRQCAHALHGIHARGVLHNDLKPDNILVVENKTPVIIDFGSASLVETKTWRFQGTYMFCYRPHDLRSKEQDLHSLCLTFVWLSQPWKSQCDMPSWNSIRNDAVVRGIVTAYESSKPRKNNARREFQEYS